MVADGGEQDLGAVFGQHAPQPAGVIMHADLPDSGQGYRAGRSLSPTRIAGGRPLGCLLRSRNDGTTPVFFLKRGKPTRLPLRLPERESDQAASARRSPQRLPRTPAGTPRPPRQAGHHDLGFAVDVDGEHSARILRFLPRVKRVDQVKPGPRHLRVWVGLALSECGFHHPQALIERKPGRAGMPGQHLLLLHGGVEAELERGVPTHHR